MSIDLTPREAEVLRLLIAERIQEEEGFETPEQLSPREIEILTLLASGREKPQIAHYCTISPHTVRNHISNILAKLGAHNMRSAIVIAHKRGIIDLDQISPFS